MLTCASPARMPPTPRGVLPQTWGNMLLSPPQIKSEPMEEGSFAKEQSNSFYSEGFHSTSPASSKESDLSPKSVSSAVDTLNNFYDNLPLNAKANLGRHLEPRNGIPYSLLTHSSFDTASKEDYNRSPTYDNSYSPQSLGRPTHISVSTPITREVSPPGSSPIIPTSPERDDRFQDSGFEGAQVKQLDGEDSRDESGEDCVNEPGLNVPAVNSHGKMKTFKCKQCDYVAVTKLTFWEHSKEHIKPEKMLKCKKCPFVTEYKHHLEYHMRNHTGIKPYRCPKCTYACVNKSMLNSHLKSHSNVYQFRCADCNYATKYCHSLKLHLRKYQHKPDVVLNLDGTPNPLPIIDVYGTRRGPKQKPISSLFETQSSHNLNSSMQPQHVPPTHQLFGPHFPVNLPYLPPILPHSFLFPPNNNYEQRTSPSLSDHTDTQATSPSSMLQKRLSFGESIVESKSPPVPSIPPQNSQTPTKSRPITPTNNEDALDLSKINVTTSPSRSPNVEQSTPVTPTTALKHRRKGRAYKLQPAALRLQHEDENRVTNSSDTESDGSTEPATDSAEKYVCQHCDITFGDNTMHAIHMGFHGYNDPFMCNKCGQRSADRLKFYLHLVTVQHS